MARAKQQTSPTIDPASRKRVQNMLDEMETLIGDMELSLYGTKSKTDIADMTKDFNTTMRSQMDLINHSSGGNTTSFVAKLFDAEIKRKNSFGIATLEDMFTEQDGQVMSYLSDEYRSKMAKYTDLQEVSTQLIELNEAVLIMRDSIVSPDVTSGSVSRTITIEGEDDEETKSTQVIESLEKKFKLLKKIKNTVIPNTLRYGTYYAYIVPYKDLFDKFEKRKQDPRFSSSMRDVTIGNMYAEKTLYDVIIEDEKTTKLGKPKNDTGFFAESTSHLMNNLLEMTPSGELRDLYESKESRDAMQSGFEQILKRITICNDGSCAIPFLEDGCDAIEYLYNESVSSSQSVSGSGGLFETVHGKDGMFTTSDKKSSKKSKKKKNENYAGVSDCYIKFIDPIHLIPCKIMKKIVGYYYIQETDSPVISGFFGDNYQNARFGKTGRDRSIVDRLATKIVHAFDKKFLEDNMEMKELIAEALMYFDLNSKSIRFQFIPVEQVCPFIINEKEDGEGTSMIEPSLFYAKLYLLLLLFKITSIILYSNDTRVNYVRTSGIDKNISNKVQEIAREKQRHQVNILDLQSYTSLLHKIGMGAEQYIPVGRANERGLETEILQGQDVQINTELMELLRTCYILGTGVPSAIMNYLNEADFAKSIEVANTRFLGRVMSYQMDFNECITNFYKMVAKHSTSLDESTIDNILFTLTPPKQTNTAVKQEAVSGFEALQNFLMRLFFGEDYQSNQDPAEKQKQLQFTQYLIEEYLPFLKIEDAKKKFEELSIEKVRASLDPSNKNTENIDDLGDDFQV